MIHNRNDSEVIMTPEENRETEELIERILSETIPDPVEEWRLVGPHSIGVITTTRRYFIVHITPLPGIMMLEELDPSRINALLN